MEYALDERRALCALLAEKGPDAPTLCEGWSTRDLAAHLVLRERRIDAGPGILVGGPLGAHTARLQRRLGERTPYADLVAAIRTGPPRLSLWAVPGMSERVNLVEYLVHHEDVRRAADGWEPRPIEPGLADAVWQRLRMAKLLLRRLPVGVEFARDDVTADTAADADTGGHPEADAETGTYRMTIRNAAPLVTVIGPPVELTMWAVGRVAAARVRLDGTEVAVSALRSARWRL